MSKAVLNRWVFKPRLKAGSEEVTTRLIDFKAVGINIIRRFASLI